MEDSVEHVQENVENDKSSINTTREDENSLKNITKDTTIKQEETTVAKQTTTVQDPTYSIQDFIENSKALGYSKEVVAGALFNCEKPELTKADFETMIKNFLGEKVR